MLYHKSGKRKIWRSEGNNICFYNEQGQCIEAYSLYGGVVDGITTYRYDEDGNCVEKMQKAADGFINALITYTYEENGHRVESVYKASDGSTATTTYSYDTFGNPIEENADSFTTTYTNVYDGDKLRIVLTEYSHSDNYIIFSLYSENGVLIEERGIIGADITVTNFQYENGLPVRVDFSNGMSYTYQYSAAYFFDAEGLSLPQ